MRCLALLSAALAFSDARFRASISDLSAASAFWESRRVDLRVDVRSLMRDWRFERVVWRFGRRSS